MDIRKHKHLTFLMNYLYKKGHFINFLIQFAHKKNAKLPKFEYFYLYTKIKPKTIFEPDPKPNWN